MNKVNLIYSSNKIDLIVPYEEEADYIVDTDGDYGLNNVKFRYEFEMSPDGKHIVRPVSEVNPYERNATFELLLRETERIAKLFGYDVKQQKQLFKELFSIVYMWYVVTQYPLSHLEKLIKEGYFKTPLDVEEFILLVDDFINADEVVHYFTTNVNEKRLSGEKYKLCSECEDDYNEIENLDEDEEDYEDLEPSEKESQPEIVLYYDREEEEKLFERLHAVKERLNTAKGKERERLEEERKAIVAKIYRLREEFLAQYGMTYLDFVIWRREKQIEKKWGWVKYPIEPEEEKTKLDFIEEILLTRYNQIKQSLENPPATDDEETLDLQKIKETKEKLEKTLQKIRYKKLSKEERKIFEIRNLINKIYRLGKDKNKLAYKLTNAVKAKLSKIRCKATRDVLYRVLDKAWKQRYERFKNIELAKQPKKAHQLSLF